MRRYQDGIGRLPRDLDRRGTELAVEFQAARRRRRAMGEGAMYLSASESRGLARIFSLLAEDLTAHDVREALGHHLLELLQADHYASYVWQDATQCFEEAVYLNMEARNLANYEAYYQYHDPIT